MRVLFVTSEVATLYKLGGLADVSYALPVALTTLGIKVDIAMPYYEHIKPRSVRCIGQIAVDFDRRRELVFVFKTELGDTRVPVYLFRHPMLNDYHAPSTVETFGFFSKIAAELYLYAPHVFGGAYDIIHCNDWHTALVPLMLGEHQKIGYSRNKTIQSDSVKSILTIHNHLYQGETGLAFALKLGIPRSIFHPFTTSLGRAIKLLREGFDYADIITTVSPTYAKELISGEQGDGIHTELAKRKDKLVGILNGIDEALWDPRRDSALWEKYDHRSMREAKTTNKALLQKALRLAQTKAPLFGFVGRLENRQKGIDILMKCFPKLTKYAWQLVILGTGPKANVVAIEHAAKRYSNIAFIHTFDERLARRIYASADVMLVPSKFEPCGLTQMIAMRYGALPIVRKTGGLADSVTHGVDGFVFERYHETDLLEVILQAITLYSENPKKWHTMIERAIHKDFSWKKSAGQYHDLYKRLLKQ